jgi:hypothetical protein
VGTGKTENPKNVSDRLEVRVVADLHFFSPFSQNEKNPSD